MPEGLDEGKYSSRRDKMKLTVTYESEVPGELPDSKLEDSIAKVLREKGFRWKSQGYDLISQKRDITFIKD